MTSPSLPEQIRVGVVNDYEVVVRGVAAMLEGFRGIRVVELAANTEIDGPVDIALYDNFAMDTDGADLDDMLRDERVGRLVLYTWQLTADTVREALARGMAGALSKVLPPDELVAGIRAIHTGQQVVNPDPGPEAHISNGDWPGRAQGITARESEIIALITRGLSNADIAERTHLSINSVKSYIRTAYRTMGVTSRSQAVLWGIDHGFTQDRIRVRMPQTPPSPVSPSSPAPSSPSPSSTASASSLLSPVRPSPR